MNKLFVHFQVFQFPFKCIYFHEYFQPRVHEMSSFRTFKISFGLFLISWIFLWSNRSASSTAVLPRETWFVQRTEQIYLLCMDFTQGLRICQEEGQWNPPLHQSFAKSVPKDTWFCAGQNFNFTWTEPADHFEILIDETTFFVFTSSSGTIPRLMTSKQHTDFKHFKFIAYITPS